MDKIKLLFAGLLLVLCSCNNPEPGYTLSDSPRTQTRSEKRGVSYNFAGFPDEEMSLLAPGISWFYNWGSGIPNVTDHSAGFYDLLYFPMAWKDVDIQALRDYKARHPECRYLLAYNEPNLTDQANMTPQQAAERWPRLLEIAKELDLQIVSPAMNYGTLQNYHDPIVWLDEFFTLINPDDICAISIHCYMASASALKSYVERFKKYDKPIWMTEFCAWEPSISSVRMQMNFMSEAVCYMELDPDIERYAWFIPKGADPVDAYPFMYLIDKIYPFQLTDCGKVYVNMTAMDKKAHALAGQTIQAEHFTDCNLSASINKKEFSVPVHFRPTTDTEGNLDIHSFTDDKWVEYQIELTEKRNYSFQLRYNSVLDTEMTVYIDGNVMDFITLPENDAWETFTTSSELSEGKHSIRLLVTEGNTCLNWLKIE